MEYIVNRDVTPDECDWLEETVKKDDIVYHFYGHTYGCIGYSGTAVTFSKDGDNPFFEMPNNSLQKLPIR